MSSFGTLNIHSICPELKELCEDDNINLDVTNITVLPLKFKGHTVEDLIIYLQTIKNPATTLAFVHPFGGNPNHYEL